MLFFYTIFFHYFYYFSRFFRKREQKRAYTILEFRAGAGAVVNLGIAVARPLAVVVGVSANYPLFGLRVITENGTTSTDSYSIKDAHFVTGAQIGIGLSL